MDNGNAFVYLSFEFLLLFFLITDSLMILKMVKLRKKMTTLGTVVLNLSHLMF